MQSTRKSYSFRADANALGGYLEEPFEKNIPTLAPVSLPAVGGFAIARSEAFTLDQIVKCSSAYTRVSGQERGADGAASILITAVVEDLNILEVVAARRVVAQVSISVRNENEPPEISLAGSGFDGLQLGGRESHPKLNPVLQQLQPGEGGRLQGLTRPDIEKVEQAQGERLKSHEWARKRHEWMMRNPQSGNVLCSLVDGFAGKDPPIHCGHVVEIPGFGRIILLELLLTRNSVQLCAIRAELGCPVKGGITISCVGGGGIGDN
jgi:hypothetical protein